ncbi:MAG: thymidine phosphorylase, partial [Candidatus Thermoplasmatota archaeon]|nr:thymidine phosphorylase [Candidatus Thermoplasmatota archaeon]
MRFQHLIDAAAAGEVQPAADLRAFVDGVANGTVSTEVATAWLKAVHQHGMATKDTVVLTKAMIDSGASLSWG